MHGGTMSGGGGGGGSTYKDPLEVISSLGGMGVGGGRSGRRGGGPHIKNI